MIKNNSSKFKINLLLLAIVMITSLINTNVFASGHDPYKGIIPANFDAKNGAAGDVVAGAAGGVHAIRNGEYAVYKDVDFEFSPTIVELYCSTDEENKGEMQLRLDSASGPLIASIKTKPDGWFVRTQYRIPISIEFTGKHDIYYVGRGGACDTHSIKFYHDDTLKDYYVFDGSKRFYDISDSLYEFEILSTVELGLITPKDENYFDPNIPVTRGQFASVVYNIVGNYGGIFNENIFTDIPLDYEYASAINQLYGMGIVKGDSETTFAPYDFITTEQAVIMLNRMLGYEELIGNKEGDYDEYLRNTPDYKLINGISDDDRAGILRKGAMSKLIYNAVNAEYLSLESISNNGNTYKKLKGILYQTKGIYKSEGVITETPMSNLYNVNSESKSGYVIIDDEEYQIGKTKADTLFGVNCEYYYKIENNEKILVGIVPSRNVSVIKLDSKLDDDIIKISDDKIVYLNDKGKEKKVQISEKAAIIYNGKPIDDDIDNIVGQGDFQGEISCVFNDNDNYADVVFIEQYTNIKVKTIDISGQKIIDELSGNSYTINNVDSLLIVEKDGQKFFADSIARGDIATVYCSKNKTGKKICRIYLSTNLIQGTASMREEDRLTIGDTEYKISNECQDDIKMGIASLVGLNIYNEIVTFDIDEGNELNLGAIIDFKINSKKIDKEAKVKLFTQNGKIESYDLADNVTIDGVLCKNVDEIYNGKDSFLGLKDLRLKTAVKYRINADNKITVLDTHMKGVDGNYDSLKDLTNGKKNLQYINEHRLFLNGSYWMYPVKKDAKVIQFWTFSDEFITFDNIYDSFEYGSAVSAYVELYSTDPNSEVADVVLVYDVSSFQNKGYHILVDKVAKTIDPESGVDTYTVSGCSEGHDFSITMNPEVLDKDNSRIRNVLDGLHKGDLVTIGRDINNNGCTAWLQFVHNGSEYSANGMKADHYKDKDYMSVSTCDIMLGTVLGVDNGFVKVYFGNNPARGTEFVDLNYAEIACYDYNDGNEILIPNLSVDNILVGDKILFVLYGNNKAYVFRHPDLD